MVSSACVELPRGPFGLVFSLRNIKNITRQVGVSLMGKYSLGPFLPVPGTYPDIQGPKNGYFWLNLD